MTFLLHSGHQLSWSAWTFEAPVVSAIFIALSFYFYAAFSLKGAFVPVRALAFVCGIVLLAMAVVSPLDVAADRLLSMHMLQHVLLTTLGPPLVLLGLTDAMLHPIFVTPSIHRYAKVVLHPVFTGAVFVVTMWFWHVPAIYDEASSNIEVHQLMHAAFVCAGFLFWWPVIQPSRDLITHGEGARVLYLFATGMPMALLALLFFAANDVIYPYYDQTPALWGLSPTDDQQIAGLVMGGLGEAASFVAITLLFFRFLDREEREATAQQGRVDAA
jgi:putative membrane protein